MSAETQQKLDECLQLYSSGLSTLARSLTQFDRLEALLIDLLEQSDLSLSGQCFAKTLSTCLSPFLTRQQTLSTEYVTLDAHFSLVGSFKMKVNELAVPLTDCNKQGDILRDQESAQKIAHLKKELAEAKGALVPTSQELDSLRVQYQAKREKEVAVYEQLSYLYKLYSMMKRKKCAADQAKANLLCRSLNDKVTGYARVWMTRLARRVSHRLVILAVCVIGLTRTSGP
uniref:Uncharacterized protein n=1 Tax=Ananas comosus var. bracteatus TaxID=296719 RepID=A0A6V7Q2X6_ANACO|nr:unnamed protein product [Ananas comosus var. bracteatus]